MSIINRKNIIARLYRKIPLILLFISVLNESDFNNLGLKYFSFNFSYILIFYYSLKKIESLGYVYIFIAVCVCRSVCVRRSVCESYIIRSCHCTNI